MEDGGIVWKGGLMVIYIEARSKARQLGGNGGGEEVVKSDSVARSS